MLRQVKLPHRGKAHDYPKMLLAQLLILEYWRSKDHVTVKLMKQNMSLMNEELGEISFGMLAQSVLGDSLRSDLEHMQKMFALLPIYRDVKRDLQLDANKKTPSVAVMLSGPMMRTFLQLECFSGGLSETFQITRINRTTEALHLTKAPPVLLTTNPKRWSTAYSIRGYVNCCLI
jgi:hypothetical protein